VHAQRLLCVLQAALSGSLVGDQRIGVKFAPADQRGMASATSASRSSPARCCSQCASNW
jgi:hypothetical protein